MSDYPLNLDPASQNTFTSQLVLCVGVETASLAETLQTELQNYSTTLISSPAELATIITKEKQQIDCLVLETQPSFIKILAELRQDGLLLPVVILEPEEDTPNNTTESFYYHAGEVRQKRDRLEKLSLAIELAISQFLQLVPPTNNSSHPHQEPHNTNFLLLQQRRLSEKLKERLGYLGVYYKRNPQDFFRHLSRQDQQKLFDNLSQEYRDIILSYFAENENINPLIDQFVNRAFFADISVSQILEIHMELIDDFSQQLKLEGRSEEILLDYRLALIDIIAHLCEMYRRSIPREDLLLDRYSP